MRTTFNLTINTACEHSHSHIHIIPYSCSAFINRIESFCHLAGISMYCSLCDKNYFSGRNYYLLIIGKYFLNKLNEYGIFHFGWFIGNSVRSSVATASSVQFQLTAGWSAPHPISIILVLFLFSFVRFIGFIPTPEINQLTDWQIDSSTYTLYIQSVSG